MPVLFTDYEYTMFHTNFVHLRDSAGLEKISLVSCFVFFVCFFCFVGLFLSPVRCKIVLTDLAYLYESQMGCKLGGLPELYPIL